jgi:hypothetical protein
MVEVKKAGKCVLLTLTSQKKGGWTRIFEAEFPKWERLGYKLTSIDSRDRLPLTKTHSVDVLLKNVKAPITSHFAGYELKGMI